MKSGSSYSVFLRRERLAKVWDRGNGWPRTHLREAHFGEVKLFRKEPEVLSPGACFIVSLDFTYKTQIQK